MITPIQLSNIVHAIYITEGGSTQVKYPYGIKSIKTNNPKRVCENTVKHFVRNHPKQTLDRYFIIQLSNIYCPLSVDPIGNKNWRVNMVRILHL